MTLGSLCLGSLPFKRDELQLSSENPEEENVQHFGILIPQSALKATERAVPVVNSV